MCSEIDYIICLSIQTGLAKDWPTDEMKTRCTIPNLLIGIPIGEI
jgi:hypothetical protein